MLTVIICITGNNFSRKMPGMIRSRVFGTVVHSITNGFLAMYVCSAVASSAKDTGSARPSVSVITIQND